MGRFVLAVVIALSVATPVAAQPGDDVPRSYESLNQRERERELQQTQWRGPSGFWTSPHKSKHGAYRYRMMGVGAVLLLGMGLVTYRLVRKASAERSARS